MPVNIPDKHKSLVFLREDVLVHGRSLDLSSISIIPPAGDSDIRLVEQLGLPKIKKAFSDELLYDNSFGNNPTSVTSFTERRQDCLLRTQFDYGYRPEDPGQVPNDQILRFHYSSPDLT